MAKCAADRSPSFARPNMSERRIVLLGKAGVGKSVSANTILGQKEFRSEVGPSSGTRECSEAHTTVSGRSVSVVDTPGLFHTQRNQDELIMEISCFSSPGPHAFLIVLGVDGRVTEEEQQIPQMMEKMFGQEVLKYSIILFTHGDLLEGKTLEELIEENHRLRALVQQCGGRYQLFNNKDEENRQQVNDLLRKIDSMVQQNGGGHYSNQMIEDALKARLEEEEENERRRRRKERQTLRGETRAQRWTEEDRAVGRVNTFTCVCS